MILDLTRALSGSLVTSYTTVFAFEGLLFLMSGLLAARIGMNHIRENRNRLAVAGDGYLSGVGGP